MITALFYLTNLAIFGLGIWAGLLILSLVVSGLINIIGALFYD